MQSRLGTNTNMEATMNDHTPECRSCGNEYSTARWSLGYKFCMPCGERLSKEVVRTIVPMHKSNYVMLTDMNDLKGINNKGGFYK
jgi:ribosomal protein L37AE/L43A